MARHRTADDILNTHADYEACKEAIAQRLDFFLALDSAARAAHWRMLSHASRRELIFLAQLRKYGDARTDTLDGCVAHWNQRYGAAPTPSEAATVEALQDMIWTAERQLRRARAERAFFQREMSAAQKALALYRAGQRPTQQADGSWLVPSETDPGTSYRVSRAGACSCKAGQHGQACKHAALVAGVEVAWERLSQDAYDIEAEVSVLVQKLTTARAFALARI